MSLSHLWKTKSLERFYRRMGILGPNEQFEPVHILVTKFSLIAQVDPRKLPSIINHDVSCASAKQRAWCKLLLVTHKISIEKGTPIELKVEGCTPGAHTCTICDQLLFNWMKERGL